MTSKKKLKRKLRAAIRENDYLWAALDYHIEQRLAASDKTRITSLPPQDQQQPAVEVPQDPEKYAAAKKKAEEARLIHDQFAKVGVLAHWGHADPCDFGAVCNVCPWCEATLAYDKIHEHTVKHNQEARLPKEKKLCPRCGRDVTNGGEKGHWALEDATTWCEPCNAGCADCAKEDPPLVPFIGMDGATYLRECNGCEHCPCPGSGQHIRCSPCEVKKIENNPRSPIPPEFDDIKHEVAKSCPTCRGRWYMNGQECEDTFHLFRPSDQGMNR